MGDTEAVHAGRTDLTGRGLHVPPIDLSSTAPLPDLDSGGLSYEALATGGTPGPGGTVYQRLWNPTVARFEDAMATLEHTSAAVAFASGMAAIAATLLAAASSGRPHVVAVRPLYGGTDHLLSAGLLGTSVTFTTPDGVAAALRPDTGLVLVESPANPTLDLIDLAALVEAAGPVPVCVDNTFATPVLQNPADFGVSLVVHSVTKYIGGHGDVVGGVVCTSDPAALRRVRAITGGLMHPLSAYLALRGLSTLPVRLRAAQASASALAFWLLGQPGVSRVFYPGLPDADPLGLLGRQMSGPGAMVSFELSAGLPAAQFVAEHLRVFTHAVSLGGVDSLVSHPYSLTHRLVTGDARPAPGLLRLSIGLEAVADLRADLSQALTAAPA